MQGAQHTREHSTTCRELSTPGSSRPTSTLSSYIAIPWKDPMLIQEVCGEPQMSHDEYQGIAALAVPGAYYE